jgi:hypothetical protein
LAAISSQAGGLGDLFVIEHERATREKQRGGVSRLTRRK